MVRSKRILQVEWLPRMGEIWHLGAAVNFRSERFQDRKKQKLMLKVWAW